DELPQLVNVLVGDMSLVGPRPEMRHYVDLYSPEDEMILEMKPGLTDWASILNFSQYQQFEYASDPDSHYLEEIRPLKLHLQRHLLDTQSAVTDVRIIYWTVASLLARETRLPRDIQAVVNSFLSEVNR